MMGRFSKIFGLAMLVMLTVRVDAARAAETQQVEAASYVTAARRTLEASLSGLAGSVELEPIGTPRDVRLPAGRIEVRSRAPASVTGSRAIVWVDFLVEGRLRVSQPVGFTVHRWDRVLVAKERLPARSSVIPQQFELRDADTAGLANTAVKDVAPIAGKRLKRELRAGAVLSTRDLQDAPAVEIGNTISIYARVGRVLVRTAAVAQRDAFNGDVIDARVPNTGERLRVRITGSNTAWISENETTSVF